MKKSNNFRKAKVQPRGVAYKKCQPDVAYKKTCIPTPLGTDDPSNSKILMEIFAFKSSRSSSFFKG